MARLLPDKTATVFVSTGELSGEMHAAHLVRALKDLRAERGAPPAIIEGNGSQRMHEAGARLLFDVATWSEMGIVHNLLKAQFFHRVLMATARYVLSNHPDMVVLVDNRVFNLNLARLLRMRGYTGRIVYYVAPVRWESLYDPAEFQRSLTNPRFTQVKRYCDLALPIYPVSLNVYEQLQIPYEYVGHPLCSLTKPRLSDEMFSQLTGIPYDRQAPPLIIGAMPGSRRSEVRNIGPPIYQALKLVGEALSEEPGLPHLHVVSPCAHLELRDDMMAAAREVGLSDLTLIDSEHTYDLMARAQLVVAKSGTSVHECMLIGVPVLMCYRVQAYVAWIAKYLLRFSMPFYALPNLLAGKAVIPELIQEECNHSRIAALVGTLLFEESERRVILDEFAKLRELVCKPNPLKRAAERLQELLP